MRSRWIFLVLGACGGGAPVVLPSVVPTSKPVVASTSAEDEWHAYKPKPSIGNESQEEPRPMYEWVNGYVGTRCAIHRPKNAAFFTCGGSVARFDKTKLDMEPFRGAPLGDDLPVEVYGSWPDDLWIKTERAVPGVNPIGDEFVHYAGSQIRFHAGAFTAYRTTQHPVEYRGGWLLFELPHVEKTIDEKAPGCADYACANLVPKFDGAGVDAPDFSALKGKIAWAHSAQDWAYAIDKKGPVWFFMRALDLATKRRVFGVARWAPGEGARFDRLPAPFDKGDGYVHVSEGSADDNRVSFSIIRPPENIEHLTQEEARRNQEWIVRWDGKKWSASRKADVVSHASEMEHDEDGPELAGYRTDHLRQLMVRVGDGSWGVLAGHWIGTLEALSPTDVVFYESAMLLRNQRPDEVLALTDVWGKLHPWPAPASPSCDHPFVVLEVLEDARDLEAIVKMVKARPSIGWGKLPPKVANVPLVETHVFGLTIIGASFSTMTEATAFEKDVGRSFVDVTIGRERGGRGIYCVHPVDPKPFVAP